MGIENSIIINPLRVGKSGCYIYFTSELQIEVYGTPLRLAEVIFSFSSALPNGRSADLPHKAGVISNSRAPSLNKNMERDRTEALLLSKASCLLIPASIRYE